MDDIHKFFLGFITYLGTFYNLKFTCSSEEELHKFQSLPTPTHLRNALIKFYKHVKVNFLARRE